MRGVGGEAVSLSVEADGFTFQGFCSLWCIIISLSIDMHALTLTYMLTPRWNFADLGATKIGLSDLGLRVLRFYGSRFLGFSRSSVPGFRALRKGLGLDDHATMSWRRGVKPQIVSPIPPPIRV